MPRYCIDVGDSAFGPIGFSAEVEAGSKAEAVAKLRKAILGRLGEEIDEGVVKVDLFEDGDVRYAQFYVNTTYLNADDVTDVLDD